MARLMETDNAFVFALSDMENFDHTRRTIDEGVNIFTTSQFAMIGQVTFDKEMWSFEDARKFLERNFFVEVSDERQAKLESPISIELEISGNYFAPQLETTPFTTIQLENEQFLVLRAIPITPGTHKGFTFSEEVIMEAIEKFEEINLVEHHHFEVPGHVVGTIFDVRTVNDNIVVTALITKSRTANNVRNEHFHSVSSSFILLADDDFNVSKITRIEELTLTDHPADPDSVVLDFAELTDMPEDLTVKTEALMQAIALTVNYDITKSQSSQSSIPPVLEVSLTNGGIKLEEKTKEKLESPAETPAEPPTVEPPTVRPTVTLSLEERQVHLENENKQLRQDMAQMRNWQMVQMAERDANDLVRDEKITIAQLPFVKQMLVTFNKEQRKLFDDYLSKAAPILSVDVDEGATANYPLSLSDLTNEQIGLLALAETNQQWEGYGLEGAAAQRKHQPTPFGIGGSENQ